MMKLVDFNKIGIDEPERDIPQMGINNEIFD